MLSSGSIAYFAPERLRPDGVRVLGPPVDVYALGILAYECLTGRLPGRRSPLPSEVRPELPPAFDALFDRMTRDEIGDRIPTMSAVVAELHAVFGPAITGGAGHVLTTAHEARPEGAAPTSVELTTGEVDVSEVEDVEPASRA
jgi:serine/threonine protein kinase